MNKKIKLVKQKHKNGCMIACLSMITGIGYDKIEKHFKENLNKTGIKFEDAIWYLCEKGFEVERRRIYGAITVEISNERTLKPFADIHLINMKQFVNMNHNHGLVMDASGKIYCPSGTKTKVEDFYEAVEIAGCFQQNTKKVKKNARRK